MSNLPQSKYDENGRPIKKGISGLFSNNNSNNKEKSYSNTSYSYKERKIIEEVKKVEDYQRTTSKKYDSLDKKFAKQNNEIKFDDIIIKKSKSLIIRFAMSSIFLAFVFSLMGFVMAIIVLIMCNNSSKKEDDSINKIARVLAVIAIGISIIMFFIQFMPFLLMGL